MDATTSAEGLLVREAGGFVLQADDGRHWALELARVPVDLVGKRAGVSGEAIAPGRLAVTAIRPA
jgi:hypothetical protein